MRKGFTLVELLVVIAIIGVLAAIVVVAINPTKKLQQSRDASNKTGMQQVSTALSAYYTRMSSYPAALADLAAAGTEELKSVPLTAQGGSFTYAATAAAGGACTTVAKDCANAVVYFQLEAPNTACASGTPWWAWTSGSGRIGKDCTTTPAAGDVPVAD